MNVSIDQSLTRNNNGFQINHRLFSPIFFKSIFFVRHWIFNIFLEYWILGSNDTVEYHKKTIYCTWLIHWTFLIFMNIIYFILNSPSRNKTFFSFLKRYKIIGSWYENRHLFIDECIRISLKDYRDFLHNSIKKSIERGMNIHDNEKISRELAPSQYVKHTKDRRWGSGNVL